MGFAFRQVGRHVQPRRRTRTGRGTVDKIRTLKKINKIILVDNNNNNNNNNAHLSIFYVRIVHGLQMN